MTISERVSALATAIGAKVKDLTSKVGNLALLNTTAKGSLVAAINEVKAAPGVQINDAAASGTTTYSSMKIQAVADAAALATKNSLLNGATGAFDTLQEVEAKLNSNDTAAGNILTAVGNRPRFDAVQTLTPTQVTQLGNNIGIGEPDTDFAGAFTLAVA